MAKRCGSSYYLLQTGLYPSPTYRDTAAMRRNGEYQSLKKINCDALIAAGFVQLRESYMRRNPVSYQIIVPLQNLKKVFFKSSTIKTSKEPPKKRVLLQVLFDYHTLLLMLGTAGLLAFWRHASLLPVALFSGFICLIISSVICSMKMRYLMQADVLLIVPAAALIGCFLDHWLSAYKIGLPTSRYVNLYRQIL